MQEISRTILAIGSHDIALELLTEYLVNSNRRFVSANAGSLGGLFALRNREAHLAGSHLLDTQTGEYNKTYINKYLSEIPVKRVGFVHRIQGFLVKRGNPKRVFALKDLINPDLKLVNRQKGSGTRVLLDYHLEKSGIEPEAIRGYSYEEYSHLSVAASIESGRADVGLGIAAAAHALNIDFIPLFLEAYELIIPDEFFNHELLRPLLDVINDKLFQNRVKELPGYEVTEMGKILI
jgi:putative molybdopterin biosynthesis protein